MSWVNDAGEGLAKQKKNNNRKNDKTKEAGLRLVAVAKLCVSG